MLFKKTLSEGRPSKAQAAANRRDTPSAAQALAGVRSTDEAVLALLDAVGGMLAAFAKYPLDMPSRPAADAEQLFTAWQRHATLGYPVNPDAVEQRAVGVLERDWAGLVQVVQEQRKQEQLFTRNSIGELQDALWACVETVHKAVKADQTADATTEEQMVRAKTALQRMQTGTIKQEVLGAITAIEHALEVRREQQQEQFVSLASKLDRLGQQLEEARRESTTDPLTGLGNRKLFDLVLARAVQMASLGRQPVVLLLCDMDKLKLVNDMHGHPAGDLALQNLARALTRTFLRQSDVVCRIGGDEFAAVLHNTDWKTAKTLARRLQEQLSGMAPPHPAMEFALGVSVGVAQLEAKDDIDSWIARSDKALYRAKQNGRDRVCVADAALDEDDGRRAVPGPPAA